MLTLVGDTGLVSSVAWSPDGKRLAVGSHVVKVYAMTVEMLISVARARATRNLTPEECRRYLHLNDVPPIPSA